MDFKNTLFAIKMVLVCFFLPKAGFANGQDDNSWRTYLESHYPQISLPDVKRWQAQTARLLELKGVRSDKLQQISMTVYFQLWKINYGAADTPDFESLSQIIDYWISELGVDGINEFIKNTTHQNPYHLFKINLQGWKAFHDLLISIGVFDLDKRSERSLKAFLLRFYWGEGISTSHSKSPEFWHLWKNYFLSRQKVQLAISDSFSVSFLNQNRNQDLIQRLYISMTKELLQILVKFPEFISPEFLLDILNPKDNILRFMFSSIIESVIMNLKNLIDGHIKISGTILSVSLAQALLPKLVYKCIEDPNVLRNEKYFKLVIKEIVSELNKTKNLTSKPFSCEMFLR